MEIPNEIQMYLNEISDRLSKGRACVMVGAGFSKNAVKIKNTEKRFLNWNELGDLFYEKIYSHKPNESTEHYLDALKLASMVESMLGRPVLNRILIDNLPDEEYGPSDLHKKLLELNWTDIFTTNYDTLLERTRKFVAGRKYQVVINKADLVYSSSPRIVKLHGSFPSARPFVITQEDYRTYPKESAPFVNTVQQALLENIMCLIGFSGDDPNFRNWIGWIRDNLGGSNTSKIYLVTVDKDIRADKALLADQNIVIVNMAECFPERKVPHKDGLFLFLSELQKRQGNNGKKDWFLREAYKFENIRCYTDQSEIKSKLEKVYHFWKQSKKNYQGWIVMPHRIRKYFELPLEDFESYPEAYAKIVEDKGSELRDFMKVYDWVRKSCLLPITDRMLIYYEKVLPELEQDKCELLDLQLSLLKYYRQNGMFEKHCKIMNSVLKNDRLSDEQKRGFCCEKAYTFLYQSDLEKLERFLGEWSVNSINYYEELVYAGLMWECEQYASGIRRLGDVLEYIRHMESVEVDFYAFSAEAYVIYLLQVTRKVYSLYSQNNSRKSLDYGSEFYEYNFSEEYGQNSRLDFLKMYDCDPTNEMEFFKDALAYKSVMQKNIDYYYTISMQFINYLERVGLPMVIDNKIEYFSQLRNAIWCISKKNLFLGIVLSLRARETKLVSSIVKQGAIMACPKEQIHNIAKEILCLLERDYGMIKERKVFEEISHKVLVTAVYLPQILSVIVCRLGICQKQEMLEVLKKYSVSEDEEQVFSKLIAAFYHSLDFEYIRQNIYEILNFLLEREENLQTYIVNCDIMFYSFDGIDFAEKDIFWKKLNYLLEISCKNSERQKGIIYQMAVLAYMGLLNKDETDFLKWTLIEKIKEGWVFPIEIYCLSKDILLDEKECKEKICVHVKEKYIAFVKNYENMRFIDCFHNYKLFSLIFSADSFRLSETDIQEIRDILKEKKNQISSVKKDIIYSFICLSIVRISCDLGNTELEWSFESKNQELTAPYILENLLDEDSKNFVEMACCFYYALFLDYDNWKNIANEMIFILYKAIKNQGRYASFSVELIRNILKLEEVYCNCNLSIIANLLNYLLELPIVDDNELAVKVCGAKLAFDLSKKSAGDRIRGIVKRWEEECNNEGTHAFIKKQWGDIT